MFYASILLGLIVFVGFFNEKVSKITYEIALMLFSILFGVILFAISKCTDASIIDSIFRNISAIDLEKFLMDGVLCFMLFAGSCHMKLLDFKKHARIVAALSIGATFLGALIYGGLIFGVSRLLGIGLTLPTCLMFGSITAPTDPIAATSILKKFNLPKDIGFIIEGESLLNDGVGVALFVFFSRMVKAESGGSFLKIMGIELFGAILVAIVVCLIVIPIFGNTNDEIRRILASLFAVATAYFLCEQFGFSGAIASVVCGVMLSGYTNLRASKGKALELEKYNVFWEVADVIMNSILYTMLGLTFIDVLSIPRVLALAVIATLINLIGRSGSVALMTAIAGRLPDNYNRSSFVKLLTWAGLRGGLSVALAMSTASFVSDNVYNIILGGTYAIVFFSTIIQGLTMAKAYAAIEASRVKKNN